ncbi:hypothetical protein NM688_g2743 [Phlebia brevispora]|uniref:Uncharacterized protein n=1 Tax=Phlebia brevispora TaxID=194682 RepID=A0ACC1T7M5_9APHY|nr:hypothetical protein NM688_g2743 [Phlebia brevispora]
MPQIFTTEYKGPALEKPIKVTVNTGLFIDGKFVDPIEKGTIDVIDPTNGKKIVDVAAGTAKDIDVAVEAAQRAFKTVWGTKTPGVERGRLMNKLADLMEQNIHEISAIEAVDGGKLFIHALTVDVQQAISNMRYFAGWADKLQGKTIETDDSKFAYTRHEPIGVCGCIVPWNFPIMITSWKLGPALATGNTIILKPSELTPLSALKFAELASQAGFPPGVINVVPGYGSTAGQAISEHPLIRKVSFTGSTLTGRKIMEAAAKTNMKRVTLELGGKNPNIVFDDADLAQAVKWSTLGIFHHNGQMCAAGSRIFVQEGIYDKFMHAFTEASRTLQPGSTFDASPTVQGPIISQTQFDRVMNYIASGKSDGAKVHTGGDRIGKQGFFVQPTIFTEAKPDMKIVREEIFGPVAVVVKFKTEEDVIAMANDTSYGLASNVFTTNLARATRISNALEAGSVYVNMASVPDFRVPFGGYKQSGQGKEMGEYALEAYTQQVQRKQLPGRPRRRRPDGVGVALDEETVDEDTTEDDTVEDDTDDIIDDDVIVAEEGVDDVAEDDRDGVMEDDVEEMMDDDFVDVADDGFADVEEECLEDVEEEDVTECRTDEEEDDEPALLDSIVDEDDATELEEAGSEDVEALE